MDNDKLNHHTTYYLIYILQTNILKNYEHEKLSSGSSNFLSSDLLAGKEFVL